MTAPLVSIVMPVYDSAHFLEQTLDMIARQTFGDFELLAINDGSTDRTRETLDMLAERYRFLHPIHLDQNGGAYNARNAGIDRARGTYLAFIDADDGMEPTRLERMVGTAEQLGLDVVCDNQTIVDHGSDRDVGLLVDMPAGAMRPLDLAWFCARDRPTNFFNIGLVKPLVRRSFLVERALRFNGAFRSNADFAFVALILAHDPKALLLGAPLYRYTAPVSPSSGKASPNRRTDAKLANFIALDDWTLSQITERLPERDLTPLLRHRDRLRRHQAITTGLRGRTVSGMAHAAANMIASPAYLRYVLDHLRRRRFRSLPGT